MENVIEARLMAEIDQLLECGSVDKALKLLWIDKRMTEVGWRGTLELRQKALEQI